MPLASTKAPLGSRKVPGGAGGSEGDACGTGWTLPDELTTLPNLSKVTPEGVVKYPEDGVGAAGGGGGGSGVEGGGAGFGGGGVKASITLAVGTTFFSGSLITSGCDSWTTVVSCSSAGGGRAGAETRPTATKAATAADAILLKMALKNPHMPIY